MEMAGASISLCKIADEEMKRWLDAPVCTPFTARSDRGVKMDKITAEQLPALYECVAEVFAEKKDELCAMDANMGRRRSGSHAEGLCGLA